MTAKKNKPSKKQKKLQYRTPAESRGSEAITVAWTVTITTLFFCDLAIVAIHFWLADSPEAKGLLALRELMLFAGAFIGVLSLLLLPAVYKLRSTLPPTGLVVFGACLAIAPILTLLVRGLQ
ncbi:hypothetical protein [Bythopirellula goksoeyrii]|uniref:Uncharacterized protein n=1 Tax=Bythopirellula goksoeyrii TaxID=1400387 RepID=A0A5B9QIL9_9BACT|nr:hypothetical protein [Bythopirellula goksoeyrii]QEG34081.1 hypothetical protein Pr1d_13530 [Bythopirellula goksoeyrii]